MEVGGKGNGITSTTMISTKTLEVKAYTKPYPDPEAKPESDRSIALFPIKKENQKPRTRVDQEAEYRECQKNHAASTGGHVVDGCCEFMPGGEEGTPNALKCAACNCHRSFHWKEAPGQRGSKEHQLMITPGVYSSISSYKEMQPRGMHQTGVIGRRASSSSGDMKKILSNSNQNVDGKVLMMMRGKKKRVRTKISEEQKEKMKEFGERLGWKMQKKDEEEIGEFCKMVNLKRQVFKVWMHNNKQAMKRNSVTQVNSDELQN